MTKQELTRRLYDTEWELTKARQEWEPNPVVIEDLEGIITRLKGELAS